MRQMARSRWATHTLPLLARTNTHITKPGASYPFGTGIMRTGRIEPPVQTDWAQEANLAQQRGPRLLGTDQTLVHPNTFPMPLTGIFSPGTAHTCPRRCAVIKASGVHTPPAYPPGSRTWTSYQMSSTFRCMCSLYTPSPALPSCTRLATRSYLAGRGDPSLPAATPTTG